MDNIEKNTKQRFTHEAMALKVSEIQSIYADSNVSINSSHQLSNLLSRAKELAELWSKNGEAETNMNDLFILLHIERIYNAIQFLKHEENRVKYLKSLLNGTLDFFEKEVSHAKSIHWELEVFTKIKKAIPETYLKEPDIEVVLDGCRIGVPCKKIFSENGVPKVLSKAVNQIENEHEFGIVAMNIDDLVPVGVLLKVKTFQEAGDRLHDINMDFLRRKERHLQKYFSASRIIAVIACTSIITDITDERPEFNNYSQWSIWTVSGLNATHEKVINSFVQKVLA